MLGRLSILTGLQDLPTYESSRTETAAESENRTEGRSDGLHAVPIPQIVIGNSARNGNHEDIYDAHSDVSSLSDRGELHIGRDDVSMISDREDEIHEHVP